MWVFQRSHDPRRRTINLFITLNGRKTDPSILVTGRLKKGYLICTILCEIKIILDKVRNCTAALCKRGLGHYRRFYVYLTQCTISLDHAYIYILSSCPFFSSEVGSLVGGIKNAPSTLAAAPAMAKMNTFLIPAMYASRRRVSSCPLKMFLRLAAPASLMLLGLISGAVVAIVVYIVFAKTDCAAVLK
jgi:hypothetical protein